MSNKFSKKSKKNGKRKPNKEDAPQRPYYLGPPRFSAQLVLYNRLRCLVSPATAGTLTVAQIGALIGLVATSAITSVFFSTVFRLKKISMWSPCQTAGTTVNASIGWPNATTFGTTSQPVVSADSSMSFDRPAFTFLKARSDRFEGQWQNVANNFAIFEILSAPLGSIIDFEYDYVIDDVGPVVAGPAIVAGVLGQIYHKSQGNVTPVNVNVI